MMRPLHCRYSFNCFPEPPVAIYQCELSITLPPVIGMLASLQPNISNIPTLMWTLLQYGIDCGISPVITSCGTAYGSFSGPSIDDDDSGLWIRILGKPKRGVETGITISSGDILHGVAWWFARPEQETPHSTRKRWFFREPNFYLPDTLCVLS